MFPAVLNAAAAQLQQRASELEGENFRQLLCKSEMEHSRYILSRLESTVFEQELWNALLPLKNRYQIRSLDNENR